MLSNTAVPKHYGEFRKRVLNGNILVNENVSNEMNRIDEIIQDKRYYYDDSAINGFIKFCEAELTLVDGSPLHLLDSFKLWAESLLSWFYYERVKSLDPDTGKYRIRRMKKRLINVQYLIVSRSNAKTLYASFLQAYFLIIHKPTTFQLVVSPTMDQAEETLQPIRTAIQLSRGPLFRFLTDGVVSATRGRSSLRSKLASTKRGIENFLTGSIMVVRSMRIDKLQGLRPFFASVDEWLSCDIRENVVNAIEEGASKLDDYLILYTSSEGTHRNGIGDSIMMDLNNILTGRTEDPHVSIWYYRLDDVSEVPDQSKWIKANPNIGYTVSYETLERAVKRAERNPFERNEILAKRFGIPLSGSTYFFTYEETKLHRKFKRSGKCTMGVDLSQGDDFCAFTFLFPNSECDFSVKTRCYVTERSVKRLPKATRLKYEQFSREGSLIIMDQPFLNMTAVFDELSLYIEKNKIEVCGVGYDSYNAQDFIRMWCALNGEYGVERVPQGARTETVPLGEIKSLAEERTLVFDQQLMSFCMGNAITIEDTNGNRKLSKMRSDRKIDSVSALIDAWVAYKNNVEEFDHGIY